jgi:hypothetical protein
LSSKKFALNLGACPSLKALGVQIVGKDRRTFFRVMIALTL